MTTAKPSDLPHQRLQAVKTSPLDNSLAEVEELMHHFQGKGYSAAEAIQLTDITLSNIMEKI